MMLSRCCGTLSRSTRARGTPAADGTASPAAYPDNQLSAGVSSPSTRRASRSSLASASGANGTAVDEAGMSGRIRVWTAGRPDAGDFDPRAHVAETPLGHVLMPETHYRSRARLRRASGHGDAELLQNRFRRFASIVDRTHDQIGAAYRIAAGEHFRMAGLQRQPAGIADDEFSTRIRRDAELAAPVRWTRLEAERQDHDVSRDFRGAAGDDFGPRTPLAVGDQPGLCGTHRAHAVG